MLRRLEVSVGRQLSTSVDYEYMAEVISRRVKTRVSPSTIKRITGYIDESVTPRKSTLDLLARALGYKSFDDYVEQPENPAVESDPSLGQWIDASKLSRGFEVELMWFPDRKCMVRFLGGELWEVIESVATRLASGQQFICRHIIAGEPLQIVLQPSSLTPTPTPYICGRLHGIRINYESKK